MSISDNIKRERGYYTAVVVYWQRRAAWVFQRSFQAEATAKQWVSEKRAVLTMYGPELAQAAE
jgi:hypothetical protein